MVTWTIFKNHLLEVGVAQNREPMALRMLTTVDFILVYHVWGPACIEIHWNSIWLRAWLHMASHYTWGPVTTVHDLGGVLGQPWTLSFGLSQIHGHGSSLVCEVALNFPNSLHEFHFYPQTCQAWPRSCCGRSTYKFIKVPCQHVKRS